MADLFDLPPPAKRKGMGGHHAATPESVTWLTPLRLVRALGPFDVDRCGFAGWPTARRLVCLPENGLAASVAPDEREWCNPPYTSGQIGAWLDRTASHGRGTALIFARTETETFHRHVWARASGLLFLEGRLFFHWPDADPGAVCMGDSSPDAHVWVAKGPAAKPGGKPPMGCARCGVAQANAGAPSVLCAYGQDDLDRLAASELAGALVPLRFARFVLVSAADAMPGTWREDRGAAHGRRAGQRVGPVPRPGSPSAGHAPAPLAGQGAPDPATPLHQDREGTNGSPREALSHEGAPDPALPIIRPARRAGDDGAPSLRDLPGGGNDDDDYRARHLLGVQAGARPAGRHVPG